MGLGTFCNLSLQDFGVLPLMGSGVEKHLFCSIFPEKPRPLLGIGAKAPAALEGTIVRVFLAAAP